MTLKESELLSKDFESKNQVKAMKMVYLFSQALLPHQKRFLTSPDLRPWFLTFISPVKRIDLNDPNSAKNAPKLPYNIFR